MDSMWCKKKFYGLPTGIKTTKFYDMIALAVMGQVCWWTNLSGCLLCFGKYIESVL